jgi:hypothetical protein
VSDLIVTVIPIPLLLKLDINKGKKVGLCIVFLLGLFTMVSIQSIRLRDGCLVSRSGKTMIRLGVGSEVSVLRMSVRRSEWESESPRQYNTTRLTYENESHTISISGLGREFHRGAA